MSEKENIENLRVLVIDDEQANLELLKEVFEMIDNCCVSFASTSDRALDLYRTEEFDLVLADVNLPDMNGFDLLEKFWNIPKAIKPTVYMLTGHQAYELAEKVESSGVSGVISKPFDIMDLITLVNSHKAGNAGA